MRVTTRLISALVAAALLVVSVIAIIELILAAVGRTPWLVDWRSVETFGQEHSWDDAAVRLIGLLFLALGAGTLMVALRRRPPVVLPTGIGSANVTIAIRRRSLERMLERQLRVLDGVASVSCRWTSARVEVRATTTRSTTTDLEDQILDRLRVLVGRAGAEVSEARVSVRRVGAGSVDDRPPPPAIVDLSEYPPPDAEPAPGSHPAEVGR